MTCTKCQAAIAEKAIVCYRCGAPTAAPEPPVRAKRPSGRPWALIALGVVLAALLAWLIGAFV